MRPFSSGMRRFCPTCQATEASACVCCSSACITSWTRLSCGCLILGERERDSSSDLQSRLRFEDEGMCEKELLVQCIARWKSRSIANKRTATASEDAKDEFVVVLNRDQGQVKILIFSGEIEARDKLKTYSLSFDFSDAGHFGFLKQRNKERPTHPPASLPPSLHPLYLTYLRRL